MEYREDSEDFNEWQHIQHPSPETSPTVRRYSGERNTVLIEENYLLHGGQIVPYSDPEDGNSSPSSPASASSMSDEDVSPMPSPSEWRPRSVANEGRKLLKLRLVAIWEGMVRVASKVRDCAICVGAFWSFTYVTGVAAALPLAVWAYVGIQRRRRRWKLRQQSMDHLAYLLKEKDEKISQLLLQIAHLNEVLSSRRKVPVLRISR